MKAAAQSLLHHLIPKWKWGEDQWWSTLQVPLCILYMLCIRFPLEPQIVCDGKQRLGPTHMHIQRISCTAEVTPKRIIGLTSSNPLCFTYKELHYSGFRWMEWVVTFTTSNSSCIQAVLNKILNLNNHKVHSQDHNIFICNLRRDKMGTWLNPCPLSLLSPIHYFN